MVAAFEAKRRRFLRRQRIVSLVGLLLFSAVLGVSLHRSAFFSSDLGGDPLGRMGVFLERMVPDLRAEVLFEDRGTAGSLAWWWYDLPLWLAAARQTVEMAIVATVFGSVAAAGASFLAARNLMPVTPIWFTVRRLLEAIRTLPDLLLALVLVAAFGIGPLAGVIALSISTMGGLGKLFTEINEEIDPRQIEAMQAVGAGWFKRLRYAVVPQVLPHYASYALVRLEGNLAAAAALGIVGAGGIGIELERAISYTEFDTYLAILLLIIGMIFVIDLISEAVRHRLMGLGRHR